MKTSKQIIYEKSETSTPIPIPISQTTSSRRIYKLNTQLFGPSMNTPPDYFISKLNQRIIQYYHLDINDSKLVNT